MEYGKIKDLLLSRRLGRALTELKASSGGKFAGELESLEVTYQYMKDYMLDGTEDTLRTRLFDDLLAKAYGILNRLRVEDGVASGGELFFQRMRTCRALPSLTVPSLVAAVEAFGGDFAVQKLLGDASVLGRLCIKHDGDRRDLFSLLWVSGEWSDDDRVRVEAFFSSPSVPVVDKLLMVSALHLSLMEALDARKFLTIVTLCRDAEPALRARASVVVLLVIHEHDRLLGLFPEVGKAFDLLVDEPDCRAGLLTALLQLLKTLETERIDDKFNKEIIPGLFKTQSRLRDRFGSDFIDMKSFNERKPEWQLEIEKSGMADKLKEIGELQQEGYDIYLRAFSKMKNFTFFGELSNWFLPFDTANAEVRRVLASGSGGKTVMDVILDSDTLCNSDKYSFCLMLGTVPPSQRSMLSAPVGDLEGMVDAKADDAARFASEANLYVQDLYRFYTLHPQRSQFVNPFAALVTILDVTRIDHVIDTADGLLAVAETMFKRERYQLALRYFNRYFSIVQCNDGQTWQKAAYCAQREGRFDEAVALYSRADAIVPNNKWILSHIASCLVLGGKTDEALEHYRLLELLDPSDMTASLQVCKCLIRMDECGKALEKLRKIDFLNPDNPQVVRMLGWCLLDTGDKGGALEQYMRLASASDNLTADDHANTGHALWVNGRGRDAFAHYSVAADIKGLDWLVKTFAADAAILERGGVGSTERDIMIDMVSGVTSKD